MLRAFECLKKYQSYDTKNLLITSIIKFAFIYPGRGLMMKMLMYLVICNGSTFLYIGSQYIL